MISTSSLTRTVHTLMSLSRRSWCASSSTWNASKICTTASRDPIVPGCGFESSLVFIGDSGRRDRPWASWSVPVSTSIPVVLIGLVIGPLLCDVGRRREGGCCCAVPSGARAAALVLKRPLSTFFCFELCDKFSRRGTSGRNVRAGA